MTKIVKTKNFKRISAILLVIVMAFGCAFSLPASAASDAVTISFDYCYDTAGNIITFQQTTTNDGYTVGVPGEELCRIYADGEDAYCIESGHTLHSGNELVKDSSTAWKELGSAKQKAINLALLYGKPGSSSNLGGTDGQQWIATQLIVWEIATGCRETSGSFKCTDSKFIGGICAGGANPGVKNIYNKISESLAAYSTVPSFANAVSSKAETYEMKYSDGKYSVTLTDENGILSSFNFKSNGDISVSQSGSKLTLTSTKPIDEAVTFSSAKSIPSGGSATLIAYGDPNLQDVISGVDSETDPVRAYFKVKTSSGNLKLVKTSDDGNISGIKFTVEGDGYSKTATTDENGEFTLTDLVPGKYTVTEVADEKYETQEPQTVTVESGKTATVKFNNELKRGELQVVKTAEDGLNEGVKFHLYGTSLSGEKVDEYAVTDESGTATFENILVSGDEPYTLEEVDTAERYVVPDSQTAAIEWNKVTHKSFTNTLKKFTVTVTKTDAETKQAQGDATLAGAKYGIYNDGELVDTYTTDENGSFTTSEYACGDSWTIKEIEPSEGYLLDETEYHVGAEEKNYTLENNSISIGVTEDVVKGNISIIKHTDDGSTKIETAEEGAQFQVFRTSAGSYENAKETERDVLVCDEDGFAQTKDLPYGVYTVHQTKGWDGREMIADFDVYICENGKTYKYLINNGDFESYVKIVKTDAETGKTVPYSGAAFQIYDPNGELVTMKYTYPEVTEIDTFYTNSEGYLITPESLPYGEGYSIVEVQAPCGYVLDSTPVYFDVTEENSTEEDSVVVTKVNKTNYAQKGTITVGKEGEVFSGVTVSGGVDENGSETPIVYQPVYETTGLAGAVYEIYAAEDITTPDGTVRYAKDTLVDTITTGEDGTATSKELYLGKYKIVETQAPDGYVLNGEPQTVELTYAGQDVSVTETSAEFSNERQKAEINLNKILEADELFGIGENDEILNVSFGLYANEEIVSASGTSIPKDGLIEIVSCAENGSVKFSTDLPFGSYYVKEISTDSHYILDEGKYEFAFEYSNQDEAVQTISINGGESLVNKLIYGSVSGIKKDEDGEALAGAKLGLFTAETEEFNEETAILTAVSADDGSFDFENVPFGNYIIKEIEAPTGFVLSDEQYPVEISENEQVVEIEIANKYIKGNVTTTKVDEEYPDNKLNGATFEVYEDTDGDKEFNGDVDTLVGELCETDNGIYTLENLRFGGYFLYEKSAPEGFVKDDNYYYFAILNDGETVTVENKAGVGFTNKPITGELEITKTDVSDGTLLPNAGFRIKDSNGNTVVEGYTDENGIATFTLRYGKYTYEEFDAPDGYDIDTTEHSFEITEDGQIIKAKMTNEKTPTPEQPQTGDNSNIGFFIGLGAVALGGIIALVIVKIKSKDDDE